MPSLSSKDFGRYTSFRRHILGAVKSTKVGQIEQKWVRAQPVLNPFEINISEYFRVQEKILKNK